LPEVVLVVELTVGAEVLEDIENLQALLQVVTQEVL
jgi:hypothetical protein